MRFRNISSIAIRTPSFVASSVTRLVIWESRRSPFERRAIKEYLLSRPSSEIKEYLLNPRLYSFVGCLLSGSSTDSGISSFTVRASSD